MLDKLRKNIAPASIDAELSEIVNRLSLLDAEREEHRLAAGHLHFLQSQQQDALRTKEIRDHHHRIGEIDQDRHKLRARRRELMDLMKPEPEHRAAVAAVPMSGELIAAINALEAARAERLTLLSKRPAETEAAAARKWVVKIGDLEEKIDELRQRRAALLEPYNRAVAEALRPKIGAALDRLDNAASEFLSALHALNDLSCALPDQVPGSGNGLGWLSAINYSGVLDARARCQEALQREGVA